MLEKQRYYAHLCETSLRKNKQQSANRISDAHQLLSVNTVLERLTTANSTDYL
ncbi:hypothetical protein HAPAU_37880 [Halalkalicoccus paucihalophilus]|uniref:Uncharacterized protein n=1 Tax=Halalkalicoccus paucihalophilus TaxID=1008153 RepID=A0A151A931_9EURY|nr:hypothetical protein HAPAU_37880 [Halalkalicoccus paucihalophilus]